MELCAYLNLSKLPKKKGECVHIYQVTGEKKKNLYAIALSEQRGAGHISGIQHLDDTSLILSSISIFSYTRPISHLLNSHFLPFIFER